VDLDLFASVLDGREKLRVHPPEPGQVLCVHRIPLAWVLVDQRDLPCVGNDHLMAQLLQQSTDPWGVRPYLQHDPLLSALEMAPQR
jgi:hypothetical protein